MHSPGMVLSIHCPFNAAGPKVGDTKKGGKVGQDMQKGKAGKYVYIPTHKRQGGKVGARHPHHMEVYITSTSLYKFGKFQQGPLEYA